MARTTETQLFGVLGSLLQRSLLLLLLSLAKNFHCLRVSASSVLEWLYLVETMR